MNASILPGTVPKCRKGLFFLNFTCAFMRHNTKMEGNKMSDHDNEDVPFMQKLLDSPFLLLFLGVVSPTVLYTLWGIVDIMNTPLAK